ncbi:MAG: hypothetical protein JNM57_01575 [Cyclobacteriaceae bacterium]|nr:hypothetical protein [Cyclobacteriaceae bacterium]
MTANSKMESPYYRILRGYALDPGFSTQLNTMSINEVIYKIRWEEVEAGPIGEYLEVVDIDPSSNCYYDPVDLNAKHVLAQGGLPPSEGNPQFHQQMVYAVIMKTIRHFEHALGRKIIWRHRSLSNFSTSRERLSQEDRFRKEYVGKLRVYPHAFRDSNAYYDQDKIALLFGYFTAADQVQGNNFPGGVVFTCLSPDVVAHETTHALLDSIHSRFIEDTNPDVGAFHEGFSDIVALLQRFTFRELVEHQLASTQGRLDGYSVLGELATQFGQALENERGALRSAIGKINDKGEWEKFEPNPSEYQSVMEPHDRGAILVATVFDAFQRIYQYKTQDLIRIATNGTGILPKGNISPDLVKRLATEAQQIAEHLLHICIRALDYCPPIDISFGNYLRALITADLDIAPEDENGYRIALIEAFRARGIFPDRVNTMSVESLRWSKPNFTPSESRAFRFISKFLEKRIDSLFELDNREQIHVNSQKLQAALQVYLTEGKRPEFTPNDWEALLNKLGMTSRPFKLKYAGKNYTINPPPLEVHKIRPAFRVGREGRQIQQVIISLSQTIRFTIPRKQPNTKKISSEEIVFRGGSTIILSLGNMKEVEYAITKNLKSQRRFEYQTAFQHADEDYSMNLATYQHGPDDNFDLNFKHLHFHSR